MDADDLNEIAAYGGFPTRYPHWSFGMQYEELKKGYDYGLSKIYEMVINNDPCYAYLMRSNHTVDQKLVMAHVYGHCLAPETEVVTEVGLKRITDVKVGDRVLTHTGEFKRVRASRRRSALLSLARSTACGSKAADVSVRITGEHLNRGPALRRVEMATRVQATRRHTRGVSKEQGEKRTEQSGPVEGDSRSPAANGHEYGNPPSLDRRTAGEDR